jgi:uncharacterized membrane protein YqjE
MTTSHTDEQSTRLPLPREATRDDAIGELARRAVDDLRVIGWAEVELARLELTHGLRIAAADSAALILGGLVAFIGLALLCATAVVALQAWIPPLWLRMLIMSAVYLAVGAIVCGVFMKRLRRDIPPELPRAKAEAQRTIRAVQEEVRHG